MTQITRRTALGLLSAVALPSATVIGVSAANPAVPATIQATTVLPVTRANQLAWELADLLNDYGDGKLHAVVHPSNSCDYAVGFVVSNLPRLRDPLVKAIEAYHAGNAAFLATPDNISDEEADAYAAKTYEPPMDDLIDWKQPARSEEGVLMALRLLRSEHLVLRGLGTSMLDAAIGYFEGRST